MRGKIIAALAATLLTVTAGVIAQTSGFPSRPRFQQVTVTSASTTDVFVNSSGAPANSRVFRIRNNAAGQFQLCALNDALSTGSCFLTATVSGATPTVDTLNLNATAVQANGAQLLAEETTTTSGVPVSGCTTDPGASARLVKIGNTVTMRFSLGGAGTCTSNSSSFSIGGALIPAAYQPAALQQCAFRGTDNGSPVAAYADIPTGGGSIVLRTNNASAIWTNSGTKGIPVGPACSYVLN